MNPATLAKLAKVLALADSPHEGEATAAVRMARQMLAQDGLAFADLARSAANRPVPPQPAAPDRARQLEMQLAELQGRLRQHHATAQAAHGELARHKQAVAQLESTLGQTREEVEKWRRLARDTANKLWDIGQQIAQDSRPARIVQPIGATVPKPISAASAPKPIGAASAPPGFSRERRFVRNSLLDAQEIGRAARRD